MWEDLGVDAVKSLATTNKSITKTSDTMKKLDKVKYDNVGDQIAGLGREFKTQITEQLNKKATPAISNFIKNRINKIIINRLFFFPIFTSHSTLGSCPSAFSPVAYFLF